MLGQGRTRRADSDASDDDNDGDDDFWDHEQAIRDELARIFRARDAILAM